MILVGHRGARHEAPENTVPGFRHAVNLGLQAVEFDIRMTKDGHLVILHDQTVDRTTDGTGPISDMTLDEARALDARSVHTGWPEPCRIPTFGEALESVASMPVILVEIKKDTPERLDEIVPKTVREILDRGMADRASIISFDPYALELARREAPQIERGYIGDWDSEAFLDTARQLACRHVHPYHPTADRALVARAKADGFLISGWQTNSADDLESVLELNPDYISSDCPTTIMELLAQRGLVTAS